LFEGLVKAVKKQGDSPFLRADYVP
jgi:hypothetical protein